MISGHRDVEMGVEAGKREVIWRGETAGWTARAVRRVDGERRTGVVTRMISISGAVGFVLGEASNKETDISYFLPGGVQDLMRSRHGDEAQAALYTLGTGLSVVETYR